MKISPDSEKIAVEIILPLEFLFHFFYKKLSNFRNFATFHKKLQEMLRNTPQKSVDSNANLYVTFEALLQKRGQGFVPATKFGQACVLIREERARGEKS